MDNFKINATNASLNIDIQKLQVKFFYGNQLKSMHILTYLNLTQSHLPTEGHNEQLIQFK